MAASVYEALAEGLACQEGGRLEEAERIYAEVLEFDPTTADAWHLMGMVWMGQRQFATAAGFVAHAIRLRPDLPAYHTTLGDMMAAQGRLREASICYDEALRQDPFFTPALVNLGNLLQNQGQLREAAAAYARAIEADAGCADAFNNLGNTLGTLGRNQEAMECYREAFRLRPGAPEAPVNMAALCLREHREAEAEEWARLALTLRPGLTQALSNLSIALLNQQRYAEAERFAREAVAQAPEAEHLYSNLASILLQQKRWDEAEQACRRALGLRPVYPEAALNLGAVLEAGDRFEEAAAEYQAAIEMQPQYADAWANLGTVRQAQGRHEEARACFDEALRLAPGHAKAHFCRSLGILADGCLEEGFAEYEWRWKTLRDAPRANSRLEWNGEALAGRTILLSAEQGLGDTIQFARYVPLVAGRGGRVIVESQPGAVPVVRSVGGVAQVITVNDPLPDFDVRASLMSLPRIFQTSLATIPNRVPYVSFDQALAARVQKELGARRGVRIGLAWYGNPENAGDRRRSMPIGALVPLRAVPDVEWFNLHAGETARAQARPCGGWVREILSDAGGLPELAALMSCLDLIVTVDTMPAHLAGALGRPVWNLLCHAPDWRWLKDRDDTPWYPTMRLFRQAQPGDWAAVIERVIQALSSFPFKSFRGAPDTWE
jgi:tetratricopeptide (TPR) repeat protein